MAVSPQRTSMTIWSWTRGVRWRGVSGRGDCWRGVYKNGVCCKDWHYLKCITGFFSLLDWLGCWNFGWCQPSNSGQHRNRSTCRPTMPVQANKWVKKLDYCPSSVRKGLMVYNPLETVQQGILGYTILWTLVSNWLWTTSIRGLEVNTHFLVHFLVQYFCYNILENYLVYSCWVSVNFLIYWNAKIRRSLNWIGRNESLTVYNTLCF